MDTRWLTRHARSEVVPAIAAIAVSLVTVIGVGALPIWLQRPAWVVGSLLFWVVIWLVDRPPLFALASWLVPALAMIGLAHVSRVPWLFFITVSAVTLVVAIISMNGRAWRLWAKYSGLLLQWIGSRSLSPSDRRICDQLVEEMRHGHRPAEQQWDDLDATGRAVRQRAERMMALDAPDDAWAEVIRAAAEPVIAYADMLEGRRPTDEELIWSLGRRRDEAFYGLLRSRSRIYRWLTFRLFAAKSTADGSSGT